jgi:hypothetical protein
MCLLQEHDASGYSKPDYSLVLTEVAENLNQNYQGRHKEEADRWHDHHDHPIKPVTFLPQGLYEV